METEKKETKDRPLLERKIEAVRQRLNHLQVNARRSTGDLLTESLEDLSIALEELEIAGEELHEQNEELSLAYEAVSRERVRYRELFDLAPNGYLETDSDGVIREANRAAAGMLRVRQDFLIGKPLMLFVLESEHSAFVSHLTHLRRDGDGEPPLLSRKFTIRPRNGTPFPVAVAVSPIRDMDGRTVGLRWVLRDVTEDRRAEEEVRKSRDQLRALTERLQAVREEERIQLAREIHDDVGQALIALKLELHTLARWFPQTDTNGTKSVPEEIQSMRSMIDGIVQAACRILGELRPQLLDHLGVKAAVQWQAREFQRRTRIPCEFTSNFEDAATDSQHAITVYRILLEALANVERHAGASKVRILLRKERGHLLLEVTDNGRGISEGEIADPASLGLLSMQERALCVDGEVRISGMPGKGTTVAVRIPLR